MNRRDNWLLSTVIIGYDARLDSTQLIGKDSKPIGRQGGRHFVSLLLLRHAYFILKFSSFKKQTSPKLSGKGVGLQINWMNVRVRHSISILTLRYAYFILIFSSFF